MAASSSVSGRASAEAELSDVSDTESVRMADLTASRWSLSDLPDSGGSEISTASAAWDAGYAYGLRLRGSSSEALGIRRMDVSHRAHHLCVLSTAVAMHQAVCVGFWRFLLPVERRFIIAACRELDFYCLQAVRNAGGRSSSIAMAFSTDGASATEAVPGPLVHRRRRTHRERFPLDRLVGSANVFRDGVLEMSLDYHGALTMSEFLSATAETCSRNPCWLLLRLAGGKCGCPSSQQRCHAGFWSISGGDLAAGFVHRLPRHGRLCEAVCQTSSSRTFMSLALGPF